MESVLLFVIMLIMVVFVGMLFRMLMFVISNCVVLIAGLTVVLNFDVLLEVSVVLMLRLTSVLLKLFTFNGTSVVLNKAVFIVKAVVFDCGLLNKGSVILE